MPGSRLVGGVLCRVAVGAIAFCAEKQLLLSTNQVVDMAPLAHKWHVAQEDLSCA